MTKALEVLFIQQVKAKVLGDNLDYVTNMILNFSISVLHSNEFNLQTLMNGHTYYHSPDNLQLCYQEIQMYVIRWTVYQCKSGPSGQD